MVRLFIAVIVVGCIVVFFGFQEYLVSAGTTDKPQQMELTTIESNPAIKNNHIKINDFWAVYTEAIYQYETSKYHTEEATDKTSIDFAYYPIISTNHPYFAKLNALEQKYGDVDSIPDKEWPTIENFSVLVKTTKFKKVGDIPAKFEYVTAGISGLVINKIKTLSSDEKKLFLDSFPSLSVDKVLILEEGRKPSPIFFAYAIMVFGVLVVIVPIAVLLMRKASEQKRQPGMTPPPPENISLH
jgi:hypothetical protein